MIPKLNEYKERFNIQSANEIKPGLASIQAALQKVENPQRDLQFIHVAGTNGKGSTVAFMESILNEHGYTTGVFSSPAIQDVHDQIRIAGRPIATEEMDSTFEKIRRAGISGMLTDFELLTVAAFVTFERLRPDYILLECGMGGLLDSTNVVTPLVSVITSIAKDHEAFLGTTIEAITTQKAGIIKEGIPVVVGEVPVEAEQIIRLKALETKSEVVVYGEDFYMDEDKHFHGCLQVFIPKREMKGPHQAINASLAIEALGKAGISLHEKQVAKGIAETSLPFRFQEIKPGVFVDGAHNPAAAKRLTETIERQFPGEKVDFVVGMLKTKDVKATLDELIPVAASFTFVTFQHPQAASVEELLENCQYNRKKVTNADDNTIILVRGGSRKKIVVGSLYLLTSLLDYKY
ncbi:folylpolyglutamate synthase/dihydrofolate synthase family protein [Sporosarcina sp. OR05]|uniref:bifunctional folylpolyglutamate synthase/dihydrofolate synthase n=1 Tax=Sporosarcina sp. OR05 TaxID=2969819 RepID=UPI00352BB949